MNILVLLHLVLVYQNYYMVHPRKRKDKKSLLQSFFFLLKGLNQYVRNEEKTKYIPIQ